MNTINSTKQTVKDNQYYADIPSDQYFFFGTEFDSDGEPILGCGKCDPLHSNTFQ